MSFLEGVKTGAANSPWAALQNEINAGYDRRRAEDAKREEEDRALKQIFAQLAKKHEYEQELEKTKNAGEIEKEYVKGEIEGNIRPVKTQAPMTGTPMAAVGGAMTANPIKSPSGAEYERTGRVNPKDYKTELEIKKLEGELAQEDERVQQKKQSVIDGAQDTLDTISEVKKGARHFGVTGNVWSMPGGSRRTWEANVNKLLASKVLETIKSMKNDSKTGATGFGALNLEELTILKNAATALKKDLPRADAEKYLAQMEDGMKKLMVSEGGSTGATPKQGQTSSGIKFTIEE